MARFNSVFGTIKKNSQQMFQRWLDRRIPSKKQHTLSHSNLFIFPSRQGGIFLLIAGVLWVLGTNYQNNLILALVFFMLALMVLAILSTYSNLARLRVCYDGCAEVFAGNPALCRFRISSDRAGWVDGLELFWQGDTSSTTMVSIDPNQTSVLSLARPTSKRGVLPLPKLGVQSVFPFGLLRCWTWLNIDAHILVYPSPKEGPITRASTSDVYEEGRETIKGSEDFSGLRSYIPGDAPRNIAWKALARGQGMLTKEFSQHISQDKWLDFHAVAAHNTEEKIATLCFWVLHYHRQNLSFGLRLPSQQLDPDSGNVHRTRCLRALATAFLESAP